MKKSILQCFAVAAVAGIVAAGCSTKKDKFVNRNYHALTTKYNVLYNGNLALDAGVNELKTGYVDNFWEILPVERMQITEPVFGQDSVPRNANFVRAEDKAIKAIEKHSMYIGGVERNQQMDEAYLLLGKARYYDQRFFQALEAFNFILLRYPDSDKLNDLKIWKEKTNIRLDNNTVAIENLQKTIKEIDFKDEVMADAYAILAQAYINEQQNDSAIVMLNQATQYVKNNEEKARYHFILGQLYERVQSPEKALEHYQSVVEMNRKSPRQYVMRSHLRIDQLHKPTDSVVFLKKYQKLLKDRENRPYLDVINHQLALYYHEQKNYPQAVHYYKQSLFRKSSDKYLMASNYRNLADLHFDQAKYIYAGKYYDSTLVNMDPKTREFRDIKRKRTNLDDVIKYETIAVTNDSILNLIAMSESDRIAYFQIYIDKLKLEEEKLQKEAQAYVDTGSGNVFGGDDPSPEMMDRSGRVSDMLSKKQNAVADPGTSMLPPGTPGLSQTSNFYFYNPTAVATGKNDFRKKWGARPLKDYWRLSNYSGVIKNNELSDDDLLDGGDSVADSKTNDKEVEPRFTPQFYIDQIPTDANQIAEIQKERNFAYYQLGMIYKDRFKEYVLAKDKFEGLLQSDPEERLVLPAMYNLYRVYEILNSDKKEALKAQINAKYPDSRYANLINNPASVAELEASNDQVYNQMYAIYQTGNFRELVNQIDPLIVQYSGEEIISKLELLKANAIGNLGGLDRYKDALNFVALTYPNSIEGKEAESILSTNIPKLEQLAFGKTASSWKVICKLPVGYNRESLDKKLSKVLADHPGVKQSLDTYTLTEDFVVLHHLKTEQDAKNLITVMRDYKGYQVAEDFIYVSSEDYKVIQVKKNLDSYIIKQPKSNP